MGFFDSMQSAKNDASKKFANSNTKLTYEQQNIQSKFNSNSDKELMQKYKATYLKSEELEVIRLTLYQRGYHLDNGSFVK